MLRREFVNGSMKRRLAKLSRLEDLLSTVDSESQSRDDLHDPTLLAGTIESFCLLCEGEVELKAQLKADAARFREGKASPAEVRLCSKRLEERLIPALGDLIMRLIDREGLSNLKAGDPRWARLRPPYE